MVTADVPLLDVLYKLGFIWGQMRPSTQSDSGLGYRNSVCGGPHPGVIEAVVPRQELARSEPPVGPSDNLPGPIMLRNAYEFFMADLVLHIIKIS